MSLATRLAGPPITFGGQADGRPVVGGDVMAGAEAACGAQAKPSTERASIHAIDRDAPTATIRPSDERIGGTSSEICTCLRLDEPKTVCPLVATSDSLSGTSRFMNQCGQCGRDVSTCTCDFGV